MATFSQVWTQIKNALKIPKDIKTAAATFRTNQATYEANLIGENVARGEAAVDAQRSFLASLLSSGDGPLDAHFADMAITLGSNQTLLEMLDQTSGDLFQYMMDNSQSINSRGFSFGALVAANTLASESLNEGNFATTLKWTAAGDFAFAGAKAVYTHATGAGTLTQAVANQAIGEVVKRWYKFVYTVSTVSGDAAATITSAYARETQTLDMTAGTHTLYFLSSDTAGDFVISGTSSSGAFSLDDLSLKEVSGMAGNTQIYRLTTDRNGQDIEATAADQKEFKCISDQNTGATAGQEAWQVRHLVSYRDELDWAHPNNDGSLIGDGPENGLGTNMSFQELSGTDGVLLTASDIISGWAVTTDITTIMFDSSDTFQSSPTEKDGTAYALKLSANEKLTQNLRTEGQTLSKDLPYMFLIHYKRQASCDGTLTIRMGSNSASVVLSSQAGWQTLALSLDQNLWYQNFDQDDLNIEIELTGNTTGTLLLDYCIFSQMSYFDGLWYLIVADQTFPRLDDTFTITDALAGSDAVIQYWLWRYYGLHLPHNGAGAETITDP